jgi:hypothetical protein
MAALLDLKHTGNESAASLVQRWSENLYWQCFSGLQYLLRVCHAMPRRSDAFAVLLAKPAWRNCQERHRRGNANQGH